MGTAAKQACNCAISGSVENVNGNSIKDMNVKKPSVRIAPSPM